jgi:glycosyltransferase involved in cell wall biosynthesis
MLRPVCFDMSHLALRHMVPFTDGITNVDLAYAQHFLRNAPDTMVCHAKTAPRRVSTRYAQTLTNMVERAVAANGQAPSEGSGYEALRNTILGKPSAAAPKSSRKWRILKTVLKGVGRHIVVSLRERFSGTRGTVPADAIYLSVAQFRFEAHHLFRWLDHRQDVRPVFLIHDLLPIDYPEFFLPVEAAAFVKRMDMALKRASALIVTSEAVRERVEAEWARRGLPRRPVLVAPLPSPLERTDASERIDEDLANVPYFVMVGTIEPRKNHLFLLALWRQMAERAEPGRPLPKLILVGRTGWLNSQALNELHRGRLIARHVIHAPQLSRDELAQLLTHARALLMPSFSEGYGIPLVEALSLGTPVVATDAPVFREVTRGRALYVDPLDGPGWARTIEALTDASSATSTQAREAAAGFVAPTWSGYFEAVEAFLQTL